jgi:hypothetical protein
VTTYVFGDAAAVLLSCAPAEERACTAGLIG